eukprot:TRINITY_DN25356_c0_g1_i1.p1 TRINITY_DN25356_c0_g1~~TRINITY_DN25356_c0_g1_i1.p1  ORF type:complete len:1016 (+),score=355.74 TRINITY_DN25356_c0_g1_i1:173-3049(+)
MQMVLEVGEVCRELEEGGQYLTSLEFHVRVLEVCRQEFGKTSKIAEEMYLNIAGLNLKLARQHYDQRNNQEATNYLVALENLTARQLHHAASNQTRLIYRARMFDLLSLVKRRAGKLTCSLRYAEKAATIFVHLDLQRDVPKSLLNLCALNSAMGLHEEALEYAYTALNAVKGLLQAEDEAPPGQPARHASPHTAASSHPRHERLYVDPDIVDDASDPGHDNHDEPPPVLPGLGTLAAVILQGLRERAGAGAGGSEKVWVHLLGVAAGAEQPRQGAARKPPKPPAPRGPADASLQKLRAEERADRDQAVRTWAAMKGRYPALALYYEVHHEADPAAAGTANPLHRAASRPPASGTDRLLLGTAGEVVLLDERVGWDTPSGAPVPSGEEPPAGDAQRAAWAAACATRKAAWDAYLSKYGQELADGRRDYSAAAHTAALRIQCVARGGSARVRCQKLRPRRHRAAVADPDRPLHAGSSRVEVDEVEERSPGPAPQAAQHPHPHHQPEPLCEEGDVEGTLFGDEEGGAEAAGAAANTCEAERDGVDVNTLLVLVYHALAVEQEHCEMYGEHLDSYHLALAAAKDHLGVQHPLTRRIKASMRSAASAQQQRAKVERGELPQPAAMQSSNRRRKERRQVTRTTLAAALFTRQPQKLSLVHEGAMSSGDWGERSRVSSSLNASGMRSVRSRSPGWHSASASRGNTPSEGSRRRRGAPRSAAASRVSATDAVQMALAGSPGKALRASRAGTSTRTRSTTPSRSRRAVSPRAEKPRPVWEAQAKSTRQQDEEYFTFIKRRKREREAMEEELLGEYKLTSDPPKAEKNLPKVTKSKKPPASEYVGCVPVSSWVQHIHDGEANASMKSPTDREAAQQNIVEAHNDWLNTSIWDDLSFGAGVSAADMAFLSSTFNLSLRTRLPGSGNGPRRKPGGGRDESPDAHRARMIHQREEAVTWLEQLRAQPVLR